MHQQKTRTVKWTLLEKTSARVTLPKFPSNPKKKQRGDPKTSLLYTFRHWISFGHKTWGHKNLPVYAYSQDQLDKKWSHRDISSTLHHCLFCSAGACINITMFFFRGCYWTFSSNTNKSIVWAVYDWHAKRVYMPELHRTHYSQIYLVFSCYNESFPEQCWAPNFQSIPKFSNIPTTTFFLSRKSTSKAFYFSLGASMARCKTFPLICAIASCASSWQFQPCMENYPPVPDGKQPMASGWGVGWWLNLCYQSSHYNSLPKTF